MTKRIYLDHNATSPLRPEAKDAIIEAMALPLNASSIHAYGREGRKIIENARAEIGRLVNAPPAQVIFNSGATEGNNTVVKYFATERILISAIEHPSVGEAAPHALKIAATAQGIVDLDDLERQLKTRTSLVSVMMVNNETGAVQPVAEIAALAHRYGALFHCDASQAAGKMPVDATGIDFLTLSSHKIGGPQGVGALALGLCGVTPSWLEGGGQEKKARAGTENTAGIAGFGAAARSARSGLPAFQALGPWRARLEHSLKSGSSRVVIHAENALRVANTCLFSLEGADSQTLLMAFDLEGVCLSNGSACSSGTVRPSPVLKAMGVSGALAASALRVSMGWNTSEEDIEAFLRAWTKISARL